MPLDGTKCPTAGAYRSLKVDHRSCVRQQSARRYVRYAAQPVDGKRVAPEFGERFLAAVIIERINVMLNDPVTLPTTAYFSMEIALESHVPTHSSGLGVLAGDTLRSAADLGLPMVGVTLLHRKDYFFQRFDELGGQYEDPVALAPGQFRAALRAGDPARSYLAGPPGGETASDRSGES